MSDIGELHEHVDGKDAEDEHRSARSANGIEALDWNKHQGQLLYGWNSRESSLKRRLEEDEEDVRRNESGWLQQIRGWNTRDWSEEHGRADARTVVGILSVKTSNPILRTDRATTEDVPKIRRSDKDVVSIRFSLRQWLRS